MLLFVSLMINPIFASTSALLTLNPCRKSDLGIGYTVRQAGAGVMQIRTDSVASLPVAYQRPTRNRNASRSRAPQFPSRMRQTCALARAY